MDDEEYELELDQYAPPRPIDWVIVGLDFVRSLMDASTTALTNVEQLLMIQASNQVAQAQFMDEARRQIEMMTEGE